MSAPSSNRLISVQNPKTIIGTWIFTVLGFFLYQAWRFMGPVQSAPPAAPQAQHSTPAGIAPSETGQR